MYERIKKNDFWHTIKKEVYERKRKKKSAKDKMNEMRTKEKERKNFLMLNEKEVLERKGKKRLFHVKWRKIIRKKDLLMENEKEEYERKREKNFLMYRYWNGKDSKG